MLPWFLRSNYQIEERMKGHVFLKKYHGYKKIDRVTLWMNGRPNYYSPRPSKKKSQTVKRGQRTAKVEKDGGEGKSASLSHLQAREAK